MRKYHHLLMSYLPGLGIIAVLAGTGRFSSFAIGNLLTQAVLFTALAAIPAHRTGKMSYVDIAWPWGLVAIGLEIPIYAPRFGPAAVAMSAAYLAIGLRMAAPGALYLARFGALRREFTRYRYRRIQWQADGWHGERVPMQLEIFVQGLANSSALAVPALLVAADPDQRLHLLGLAALLLWARCWTLEWVADLQKRQFAAHAARTATCNIGLWRYSRHPNYFFQWLGWVALALASAPALVHLGRTVSVTETVALGLALTAECAFMLWTLLELTGIKPAEHFSVQKRPAYAEYQRTTNRFVPGPRRA